jgi:hypothetical protein
MSIAARYRRLCNRAGEDGWSRLFGYPLARLALVWLERIPALHPNHLTLASIGTRAAGAGLLLSSEPGPLRAGVVLLQLGQVLDSMDGTLARARGQHSPAGAFLDKVGDALCLGLLAAVVGLRAAPDGALFAVAAVAGAFLNLLRGYMHWVARALAPARPGEPLDGARPRDEPVRPFREWLDGFRRLLLAGEADLYLWVSIAAVLGAWREAAVILAVSQAIAVLAMLGVHLRRQVS